MGFRSHLPELTARQKPMHVAPDGDAVRGRRKAGQAAGRLAEAAPARAGIFA